MKEPTVDELLAALSEANATNGQLMERLVALTEQQAPAQDVGLPYGIIDPDYARIFTKARCIAWQDGYAVMKQGSFTRDLDLLLVPWTKSARKDSDVLVARIAEACDLRQHHSNPVDKPHGRKSYTLHLPGFAEPRWVDMGVMPVIDSAALDAHPAPAAPDGWRVVPAQATSEWGARLIENATQGVGLASTVINYVLAAAPHPAAPAVDDKRDALVKRLRLIANQADLLPPAFYESSLNINREIDNWIDGAADELRRAAAAIAAAKEQSGSQQPATGAN